MTYPGEAALAAADRIIAVTELASISPDWRERERIAAEVERFAAAAVARERERAAKLCEAEAAIWRNADCVEVARWLVMQIRRAP